MSEFSTSLAVSASAMQAQSTRMRRVSENISNADTPGYRRKMVSFRAEQNGPDGAALVSVGRVRLDRSELKSVYDPAHPLADETGNYKGSNVNLLIEIADAREARRSYEANLKMFDQTRQMSSSLLDLLKR
jgi:flagellar basal-body rod protein FlgC